MKILQVSPEYPPYHLGGGGVLVKNLSQGLARKGFDITVAAGYYPVRGFLDRPFRAEVEGVTIKWLPLFPTPNNGFQLKTIMPPNPRAFMQLIKIFFDDNFDLIHIHGFGHAICDVASILCRITHKPYILTIHGFPKEPERRGGILKTIYQTYSRTIGVQLINHAEQTVTVSRSTANEIRERFPQNRTKIIKNAVDLQGYFPIHPFEGEKLLKKHRLFKKQIILCIGRLSIAKGFQYAIRALPSVIKDVPNAHLVIIGKDEGYGYLNELKKIVNQEKMGQHVTFVGGVTDEEKKKFLGTACLVLIPSIEEPFGIVALEAMAARKPIVATKVGGLVEILSSDPYSMLVDPCDVTKIGNTVITTLCKKEIGLEAEIHSVGRLKQFELSTMVDSYAKLYGKIIS
jgi:glycogen(starch) synthase